MTIADWPNSATTQRRVGALEAERSAVVVALRRLCEEHGDLEWDDDLHLADVIEKHLGRYLNEPKGAPMMWTEVLEDVPRPATAADEAMLRFDELTLGGRRVEPRAVRLWPRPIEIHDAVKFSLVQDDPLEYIGAVANEGRSMRTDLLCMGSPGGPVSGLVELLETR